MDRINSASHIDKLAAHTSQGCEWKKYQGFSSEQIPGVVSQNHNLQQCAKNLRNLSVQKHTPTNIEGTQVDTIFFDSVPKIDVETRFRKEVMNGWCWKKKVWIPMGCSSMSLLYPLSSVLWYHTSQLSSALPSCESFRSRRTAPSRLVRVFEKTPHRA